MKYTRMTLLCEEVRKTKGVMSKSHLRVERKGKPRATKEIMRQRSCQRKLGIFK